jgi:hypothetical protein
MAHLPYFNNVKQSYLLKFIVFLSPTEIIKKFNMTVDFFNEIDDEYKLKNKEFDISKLIKFLLFGQKFKCNFLDMNNIFLSEEETSKLKLRIKRFLAQNIDKRLLN